VSNSCNFAVLPQLHDITANSLEYFFASSSAEILAGITEKTHFEFPVRPLQADFEKTVILSYLDFYATFNV
jgi:hypothetical protein